LRQKLACPFCRASFASAKQVRKDGWRVLQAEWSTGTEAVADSLDHDIASLQCQMNEFCWMKDITTTTESPSSPQPQANTSFSADETSSTTTSSRAAIAFLDTAENNFLDGYVQLPRQFHKWIETDDFVLLQ
jgi:hypothetical protein